MRAAYSLTTPPANEPVSVKTVSDHCRVDSQDELLIIQGYVATAREYVEGQTGRALLTQSWRRTADRFVDFREDCAGRIILLDRTPLVSVESVKYYPADGSAQATLSPALYHVVSVSAPGMVCLKDGETWPDVAKRPDAVEINFTAGAADASAVPPTIRHAITLLAAHFYEQRQPLNVGNIVNEIPFALEALINSQRVGGWIT